MPSRCYGCEEGCDSCIKPLARSGKPLARSGKYDTNILIQHMALLEKLITSKLDDLSKKDKCLYSLKKQEPSSCLSYHAFISNNEGTIMMGRSTQRRDNTEIVVERLKDGKIFDDESFIITISPGGVNTWNNIMTYERCKGWCDFFEPIVREWLSVIRTG
jgi:hypothetical protein